MIPFSFKPIESKEQAKIERDKKEIEQNSKEMLETLSSCLSSDDFAKYRDEYKKGEKKLIQLGIDLIFSDPVQYAMAAHSIFRRLEIIGELEVMIQRDMRRKK